MAVPGLGLRPAGRIQEPAAARAARPGAPFLPWLVALVALSLMVSLEYSRYLFADSYYDLYAGRYIVQHGIPHHNVVTVVAHGAPWIDQQWLAQVIYYGAWAAGGYPAVALLSSLVLTSGFAVLALAMRSRGVPPARVFLWTCAALIVYLGNIVIRAQSFAYPLFALTLWLVVADSRGAPAAGAHLAGPPGAGAVGEHARFGADRGGDRRPVRGVPGRGGGAAARGPAGGARLSRARRGRRRRACCAPRTAPR